ncbi:DENN domain-containing protein 10-like [Ylistrum balloti]|uniref:DENN domain-containing protein 10-like n=1 Tax=Ylistrum balloti TaxID=509963 RepID=UPI0029057E06|nr:DENN domain-containing protein 10-like [Ylistrum balloti]
MSAITGFISGKSAGLIERDTNGDVLWTWSYPSVVAEDRKFFMEKSQLQTGSIVIPFLYSQWKGDWYYMYSKAVTDTSNLPKVTHFSLVLVAKDFNPEKYEELCKILSNKYQSSGNPASMLESYLSVFTRGSCSTDENGRFSAKEYDNKKAYLKSELRGIIETFGMSTVIIYTALMLKKRIAVYYPPDQIHQLLMFVRSLPALVWHRQNWNIAFPFIEMNQQEVDYLKGANSYVAGFTDASLEGRNDLYDVYVSPTSGQISIATQAKEALAMGKLHKDTAAFMVQCAESEELSEEDIVKEIAKKTSELLNNLKSLAVEGEDGKLSITLETLRARKMNPATENFLFSLAACEGLVKL